MDTPTHATLVRAAQTGDQMAFETLVGLYQRELLVHCYRMLGSFHEAEDLVQETLLRAWEKRATLTSLEAYRAWLYRIATNLCLNRLMRAPRRSLPIGSYPPGDPDSPLPTQVWEPIWLEPFPDDLFADEESDPLEELVPHDHFYRQLHQKLDLSYVRDLVQQTYTGAGRPSIDPVVFFKLQLVMFFEGVVPCANRIA